MELTPFTFLAAFAGIQLLAAISPGPAFAVVTQRALQGGRAAGLAATGGCTLGLFFWLSATMVGLAFLISTFWWLYAVLRVLGGLFLIYLAFQLWRHAHTPFASSPPEPIPDKGALNHFRAGLFVQLSNPKGAVSIRKQSPDFRYRQPCNPFPWRELEPVEPQQATNTANP